MAMDVYAYLFLDKLFRRTLVFGVTEGLFWSVKKVYIRTPTFVSTTAFVAAEAIFTITTATTTMIV